MENDNSAVDTGQPAGEIPVDLASVHSGNLPALLRALNLTVALTSYDSGSLILLRSGTQDDAAGIDTHFKPFPRPMGLAVDGRRLTLGTLAQVLEFRRADELLPGLRDGGLDGHAQWARKLFVDSDDEEKLRAELAELGRADALYIARAAHVSGMINIHDIAWGKDGLWVVNSTFSCLATLSPEHSFVPRWQPPFISELAPEDRCHLNGMTLKDGKPAYVTTFSKFDSVDGWRNSTDYDGTLIDVTRNQIVLDGLVMPHSPRWHEGAVYFCNSGRGEVCRHVPGQSGYEVIAKLPGYPRGMTFLGPLLFVGLSKVRASDVKKPAPVSMENLETHSGLWIIDLQTGEIAAWLRFTGDIDQIYDIGLIPGATRPELLEFDHLRLRHLFAYPPLQERNRP